MSFQAYLNTIKTKTGKGPADFRQIAEQKGFTQNWELKVKAADIVKWLKDDYDLGHGHAMAIYALLKGIKNEDRASNLFGNQNYVSYFALAFVVPLFIVTRVIHHAALTCP